MAEQAEQSFVKTFLNTISSQPVTYSADYQQPPENWLKKVPLLPIPLPPLPVSSATASSSGSTAGSASISVTFKSLKPPASYTILVHPADSIASIKAQLASQPTAPPTDAQRLLIKGKALADTKLLQEYSIKDGDVVNLVVKPSVDWDPSKPQETQSLTAPSISAMPHSPALAQPQPVHASQRGHQRIPSVVLSPSPSNESSRAIEKDIVLQLDSATIPGPIQTETLSSYGISVSRPEFWQKLYAFLKSEFTVESDALTAFEEFLRASKSSLTANQIAKIRDQVGIMGMAGT